MKWIDKTPQAMTLAFCQKLIQGAVSLPGGIKNPKLI